MLLELNFVDEMAAALIPPSILLLLWFAFVSTHNRIIRNSERHIKPRLLETAIVLYGVMLVLTAKHIFFRS
jgi:hypothetical protein